jgi:hypothetical protein
LDLADLPFGIGRDRHGDLVEREGTVAVAAIQRRRIAGWFPRRDDKEVRYRRSGRLRGNGRQHADWMSTADEDNREQDAELQRSAP